ncbi:MAG TPA: hypothetical protein VMY41_09480, partial [Thermohalobaculum sp.]|nr:hypothetical protein [Thermohalobaculum sp.]
FRDTVQVHKDCRVFVSMKLDGMNGLYTTWSPSISDGRVLKFLDRKEDVKNFAELPEHFDSVGVAGGVGDFSVSVLLGKAGAGDEDED